MPMNPLTLMMSRGMQPVPPDYAMPGPAPDMRTAYAQMAAAKAGPPGGGTDQEIVDFINELKPHVMNLPPPLQLKFSKLWEMVESQAAQNEPELHDSGTADMAAHYGPSAAPLQDVVDSMIDRDGPPGSENWDEGQWDEWEEEQDRLGNIQLESILRGYGKR